MSIQVFYPFLTCVVCVFLILSCMICLHMLDINPLSVILFINIFSHSVCCLFILLMVSFAMQKLLSLIRSCLFLFAFISFTLGDRCKKIFLQFMSKSVLLMFSSRRFMVSCLTFRSLIHFRFIFVYRQEMLSSHCFTSSCPVFPASLVEKNVVSSLYILHFFVVD